VFTDLWREIQSLSTYLVPEGNAADLAVADIEGQTRLKGMRGQQVVDLTCQLPGYDLWNATYWMDVRKAQDASRSFGAAPSAVWAAFRKQLPWQQDSEDRPTSAVRHRRIRVSEIHARDDVLLVGSADAGTVKRGLSRRLDRQRETAVTRGFGRS